MCEDDAVVVERVALTPTGPRSFVSSPLDSGFSFRLRVVNTNTFFCSEGQVHLVVFFQSTAFSSFCTPFFEEEEKEGVLFNYQCCVSLASGECFSLPSLRHSYDVTVATQDASLFRKQFIVNTHVAMRGTPSLSSSA